MAKKRKPPETPRLDERVAVMADNHVYGVGIDYNNLPAGHPFLKKSRDIQVKLLNQIWGGFQQANTWHKVGKVMAAQRCAALIMRLYDGSYWDDKRLP